MEEEIDLRAYVLVLLKYWKWILGTTVAAAVVALVVSFLLPPTYEATALVIIRQPQYMMQFDPRFEILTQQPAYKAYPDLARGDEVLEALFARLNPRPAEIETLRDLQERVEAKAGTDPSVVRLTVRARDPQEAARIANLWAELFVAHANRVYGASDEELQQLEGQLAQAQAELEAAEQALIEFQARNQASILDARLDSLKSDQAHYLADQRAITYILQDIQALREQLARQPDERPASLADDLTTLFLQIKAFNAQASAPTQLPGLEGQGTIVQASAPIQLQVNSAESLSNKSIGETMALLDDMAGVLEAKSAEIGQRLEELQPQILSLQKQLQEIYTESDRLTRQQDLAKETYTALARKVEETRIAVQGVQSTARLGSRAAVPEKPAGPRKLFNTAVAGALGLMLSVFGAFGVEWWRSGTEERRSGGAEGRRGGGAEGRRSRGAGERGSGGVGNLAGIGRWQAGEPERGCEPLEGLVRSGQTGL
jgi:succinoglycan biosynthesis transport protein ExoP